MCIRLGLLLLFFTTVSSFDDNACIHIRRGREKHLVQTVEVLNSTIQTLLSKMQEKDEEVSWLKEQLTTLNTTTTSTSSMLTVNQKKLDVVNSTFSATSSMLFSQVAVVNSTVSATRSQLAEYQISSNDAYVSCLPRLFPTERWSVTDTCECALGWNGTSCSECVLGWNGTLCNECASGYYGSTCLACSSCSGHGFCNDGLTGNGSCACSDGFLGANCNVQKVLAPDGATEDRLGHGGAYLSADGRMLAATATGDDDQGSKSGSLYVWRWNSTTEQFVYLQKLLAPDGLADQYLGSGGVALSGNGSMLATATSFDDDQGNDSGSLYVWRWNSTTDQYSYLQKLLAPDGDAGDYLGAGRVALDGDGRVLVAPAHRDDAQGLNSGSLYVWLWNSTIEQFSYVQKLLAPDTSTSDYLGEGGVSLSVDGNALAAGSHGNDDEGNASGSLYVWRWSSSIKQFVYLQKLLAPDGAAYDWLGYAGASLSGDGSVLAASARADDDQGKSSGSLYVWRWNSTTEQFEYLQKLLAPDGDADDYLGSGRVDLSSNGSVLAAAAYGDDDQGSMSGSLYVWGWNSMTEQFTFVQKLLAPDGAADDHLGLGGVSLSGDGRMLAAGAHWDDDQGSDSGSLYVWQLD